MKNVVLYGGSFNPPCIHHIQIVQAMASNSFFSKIVVIPCGRRDDKSYIDNNSRMFMSKYAFAGIDHVVLDFRNLKNDTFTSNYHLESLYRRSGDVILWHAVGSDLIAKEGSEFNQIQRKWANGCFVWDNFNFLIIPRRGHPIKDILLSGRMMVLQGEFFGSSTDVRLAVKKGEPFKHFVGQKTHDIIIKNNLYR